MSLSKYDYLLWSYQGALKGSFIDNLMREKTEYRFKVVVIVVVVVVVAAVIEEVVVVV